VLKVRWDVYAAAKKWEAALEIAGALIQGAPEDPLGWCNKSYDLLTAAELLMAKTELRTVVASQANFFVALPLVARIFLTQINLTASVN
jgi:hypothetical protein